MHRSVLASASLAMMVLATTMGSAQQGSKGGEWRYHSGDLGSTKYSALDQINKANVSRLRIAWRRPAVDASIKQRNPNLTYSHDSHATPIMVDGVLYTSNGVGLVEAFDPGTGRTVWVEQPSANEPQTGGPGESTRTIGYWTQGNDKRIYVIRGENMISLDARTGRPVANWGDAGRVN